MVCEALGNQMVSRDRSEHFFECFLVVEKIARHLGLNVPGCLALHRVERAAFCTHIPRVEQLRRCRPQCLPVGRFLFRKFWFEFLGIFELVVVCLDSFRQALSRRAALHASDL